MSRYFFQSSAILSSVYESFWYEGSNELKKSMIIFMIKAQEPVILSMGKFGPITMETFTTVSK